MTRVRAIAAAAALAGSVACNNQPTSPNIISSTNGGSVSTFITAFQTVTQPTISGSSHGGTVSLGSGGPTVTATGSAVALNGGGNIVSLQSPTPFLHAFVSISGTGAANPPTGFYEIDVSAPVTSLQVLVTFAATLPAQAFSLDFNVTDANGGGGPASVIAMTVPTTLTTSVPAVIASYTPSPAPYLGGAACTLSLQQGCLWEFSLILQEENGIGVSNATLNETFTFGSQTITSSLIMSIPAHGQATVVRNLACGAGGASCATPAELAGGTYTYTITGNDDNGTAFTFTGPPLMLSGQ